MLSSKQLLKDGRYSIERSISTGPAGTIYLAQDTQRKATVAIIERRDAASTGDLDGDSLARTQHEGLVRINDDFLERSCRYSATEPLSTSVPVAKDAASCHAIFACLGSALLALNAVRSDSDSPSGVEISPETLVTTADDKIKLLYPGANGFSASIDKVASSFAALEAVWEHLDHITQKAIYNSYDEASLAVLESAADSRTDLYSLGAIFYRILTGHEPVSAVERAIEMLDSNADPLKAPTSLNPVINVEQSSFLIRMLEVRREQRFGSIEDAIFSLPSAPQTRHVEAVSAVSVVPEPEDFPLLEIPLEIPSIRVPVPVPAALSVTKPAAAESVNVIPKVDVDTSTAFKPPFIEAKKTVEKSSLPLTPTQVADRTPVSEPSPKLAQVKTEREESVPTFESGTVASGGSMKFVAVGAGALVVAVAIGWAVLGGSSSAKPDPSASLAAPVTAVEQQPAQTQAVPEQAVVEPAATVVPTDSDANSDPQARQRPQIADTRAVSQKTPKPAAKNEAKPTKKLTVDDLIN